ncbi:hypothetical protein OROGR_002267 [Orobanche gracilis]
MVIFSLDRDGWVQYFDRSVLGEYERVLAKINERDESKGGTSTSRKKWKSRELINLSSLNDDRIRVYCIMKGCDYYNGTGYSHEAILKLVQDSDYNGTMQKAYMTYKHHLVFDPHKDVRRVVNLTNLEEENNVMSGDIARQIADGILDPKDQRPYKTSMAYL